MKPAILRATFAAVLALTACREGAQPTGPDLPEPASPQDPTFAPIIQDASRGGVPGFYFLPPLAPLKQTFPGSFDPEAQPVVEVCARVNNACSGEPIARFTRVDGIDPFTGIILRRELEAYVVYWRVRLPAGDTRRDFRVRVLANGVELGFADIVIVKSFWEWLNTNWREYVPLFKESVLPVRFRLSARGAPSARVRVALPNGLSFSTRDLSLRSGIRPAVAGSEVGSDVPLDTLASQLLVGASPEGTPVLLAILAGSPDSTVLLDLQSTAEALVFLSPRVITSDAERGKAVLASIRADARLTDLAVELGRSLLSNGPEALLLPNPTRDSLVVRVARAAAERLELRTQVGTSSAALLAPLEATGSSGVTLSVATSPATVEQLTLVNQRARWVATRIEYSGDGSSWTSLPSDNGISLSPRILLPSSGLASLVFGRSERVVDLSQQSQYVRLRYYGPGLGRAAALRADPSRDFIYFPSVLFAFFDFGLPLFEVVTGVKGLSSLPGLTGLYDPTYTGAVAGREIVDEAVACLGVKNFEAVFSGELTDLFLPLFACLISVPFENPAAMVELAVPILGANAIALTSSVLVPLRIASLSASALDVVLSSVALGSSDLVSEVVLRDATDPSPEGGTIAVFPLDGDGTEAAGRVPAGSLVNVYPGTDRFGQDGGALRFDGAGQVTFTDLVGGRLAGTINVWIRTDDEAAQFNIFAGTALDPGGNGYLFRAQFNGDGVVYSATGVYFLVGGELGAVANGFAGMPPGTFTQWNMMTFTWSPTTKRIYLNGVERFSAPNNGRVPPAGQLVLSPYGQSGRQVNERLRGELDDLKIWSRELGGPEVAQLYATERP